MDTKEQEKKITTQSILDLILEKYREEQKNQGKRRGISYSELHNLKANVILSLSEARLTMNINDFNFTSYRQYGVRVEKIIETILKNQEYLLLQEGEAKLIWDISRFDATILVNLEIV